MSRTHPITESRHVPVQTTHVMYLCKNRCTYAKTESHQVPVQKTHVTYSCNIWVTSRTGAHTKTHVTYSCNTRVTSRTCAGFLVLLSLSALPGVRVEIGETFTLASSLLCALSVHHALTCGTKVITLTPPCGRKVTTLTLP